MRRTERLFQTIQIMRRAGGVVRAREIAAEVEVSERTVYRDIAALRAERVPIDGEAGVGYRLAPGYDLPPLMFSEDELEALLIGARIVGSWADPALGRAATDVLAKIGAVLPASLKPRLESLALVAPPTARRPEARIDVARLRQATRAQHKVAIDYCNEAGVATERTIWPMTLAFFPPVWLCVGWCELRQDFRSFRVDRIAAADFTDERYPQESGKRLIDYQRRVRDQPA